MAGLVQGIFKPQHPEKYKGNVRNIIYRSSYELKYLMELDRDDKVIRYSSEEVIIRYRSPLDGKNHRYFIDFYVERMTPAGLVTQLIEIKPYHQTLAPVAKTNRKKRTFLREVNTYVTNQAKWEAATIYAKAQGWEFVVKTEYDLGIKKR